MTGDVVAGKRLTHCTGATHFPGAFPALFNLCNTTTSSLRTVASKLSPVHPRCAAAAVSMALELQPVLLTEFAAAPAKAPAVRGHRSKGCITCRNRKVKCGAYLVSLYFYVRA